MALEQLLSDLSGNGAYAHVAWLTDNVPNRQSGSENEHRAAEYFVQQLACWGVPVRVHEFPGYVSWPGAASVEVLAPERVSLPCNAFAHIASTPPEGIEADLVDVGHGAERDYAGKDVRGKIVVALISYEPPRPEKVRLAQLRGAVGVIMHNYTARAPDLLPEGTCKSVWGNPTDEDARQFVRIPASGVSFSSGAWIRAALSRGRVRARLRAEAERRWSKLILPVVHVAGQREPETFTIFGGHYDSWSKGATDNATGSACTLELARAFWTHRQSLARGVMFVWWPAHEQGIMAGSTWFVDSFWPRLAEGGIAYLNVDSTGLIETRSFAINASPILAEFARGVVRQITGHDPEVRDLPKTGDQSFFGVGVPSVSGRHHPDAETLKRWGGTALGWWWHSAADTLDKVDPVRLEQALRVYATWIWELSTQAVLPYRFSELARRFDVRLAELEERAGGRFDLAELRSLAERVRAGAEAFDRETDALVGRGASFAAAAAHNAAGLRACRELTPAGFQVAPRWQQDSYGLSDLAAFIPSLRALEDLGRLQTESHEFNLKCTRLLRARNRVRDHLFAAAEIFARALG